MTIIGGGVMGLMTAYHAAPQAETVTVLEKSRVGDPAAASFGLTRSARNDYRDPEYARLAFEARRLWLEFQKDSGERLLVDCGCLNLAKRSVTPELSDTYAVQSFAVLEQLRLRREVLSAAGLAERYPQFDADGGWLDVDAGFVDVAAATRALGEALRIRGVRVLENIVPRGITRSGHTWSVATDAGPVESDVLVITAGVYGHPLYDGKTPGVKIGFYHPPDATLVPSRITSVEGFVAECMPGLRGAESVDVAEASGVDGCSYDLVADDEFILGPVPGADEVFAGPGGVVPDTSSPPGWGGCSPGWPCGRAPGTTFAASHLPGSQAAAGLTS